MAVEITRFEQSYDTDIAAQIAAKALCTATGRVWQVNRTQNCVFTVVLEPILKAPSGADLEEALKDALDQWVEQYNLNSDDDDIDFRNPMFGSIGTDYGFTVTFQNANKEFGIMIQERDL